MTGFANNFGAPLGTTSAAASSPLLLTQSPRSSSTTLVLHDGHTKGWDEQ